MTFVFSFWYIVLALLVAGIVACVVLFVKMDKKDQVLINDFLKSNAVEEVKEEPAKDTSATEQKSNE